MTLLHSNYGRWRADPSRVLLSSSAKPGQDSSLSKLGFALLWLFVFAVPMENVLVLPGIGTIGRLIGLLALPFCVAAIVDRGWLRSLSPIHGIMAMYVFWVCLTYIWSVEPVRTLSTISTCIELFVMVWLLWQLAARRERQLALLKAFVSGAMVSSVATLTIEMADRPAAFGFDPNDLALALALSVPMSLYLAEFERGLLRRMIYRFQTVVAIAAVFMTGSRGAALALGAALMLIPLNFLRWSIRQRREVSLVLLLALGAAVLFVPATSWKRVASTADEIFEGSLNQRRLIWQAGWEVFREHPFLGVGASAFGSTAERHFAPASSGELVAHNTFLSVLFEGGVVGFSIYIILLLAMIFAALQMPRPERNLWLVSLLTWGIGVCGLTWEYRKPTWFLFGMLTVWAAGSIRVRQQLISRFRVHLPRPGEPPWEGRHAVLGP